MNSHSAPNAQTHIVVTVPVSDLATTGVDLQTSPLARQRCHECEGAVVYDVDAWRCTSCAKVARPVRRDYR